MRTMSGSPEVGGVSSAGVAAMPSPPSPSLPLQGGGNLRTAASPWAEAVSLQGRYGPTGADLLATMLMFGTDRATSSPPPSRGRDREGGLGPFDRSSIAEEATR